jgi:Fe-S-cluster-containing hydrogenase component 2
MGKKILIDLIKLRDLGDFYVEAIDQPALVDGSFKTVREIATFQITCRRCKDAPCVAVCPADALEKGSNGMINRSVNLCIRCKSCIAICPFGTMMNDLFQPRAKDYTCYDIRDDSEMEAFAARFPDDVVKVIEGEPPDEEQIFELNERILIHDQSWHHLNRAQ